MSKNPSPESPLAGTTVLELGQFIAGPFASQILADLGARVIKIERPGSGDPFRLYVTEPKIAGYGHNFLAFNRNKESVAVDLQRPEGLAVVRRLAAKADVVLENFRAGVLERLGLGYEAMRAINPRLVYCAISGFSEDGPYRDRPAFDTVGQALSGMLYLFTDPTDPRMRGPTIADQATAMQASNAVLAALYGRERSGEGAKIEISMIEAAIHFMPDAFTALTESGIDMGSETRTSYSHAFVLRCADDKLLAIHVGGPDRLWQALCAAVDDPHIGANPIFQKRHSRIANYAALIEAMRPVFMKRPREEWLKRLADRDVASAEINTIAEAIADAEVAHLGLFEKRERPGYGAMTMLRRAPRINGAREPQQLMPPLLGEHTESVLREFGHDDAALAKLREAKII
ncbi:MAG TPA: CaiB/BaiF CoA-transferase family protein [Stellaceae bacterium]|nr:CaiB/BaiF CoA-transferase family protein [Stellaceae bacterium]